MNAPAEPHGKTFYGWWIVSAGFFVYGFAALLNYTYTVYAPFILKEMNWTRADFGNVYSVYLLVMLVLAALAGWFIDRFGPKLSIMIGAVLGALGMVLFSTMQTMTQAYLYFAVIMSLAVVLQLSLPTQTLARRWFLKKAAFATGLMMSSFALIGALFFPLLAKLAAAYGWRPVALWSGIIIEAAILLLVIIVVRDTPESMGLNMDGMSDAEAKAIIGVVGQVLAKEPHMTRGEAVRTSQFWILGLSLAMAGMIFTGFMQHITMIGLSVGMTAAQAATVMTAWALPSFIGRLGGGWVADRIGKRKVLMGCGVMIVLGYLYAWLFATSATPLYIFAVWAGIFMSPLLVILPPLFGDLFGRLHLASILGLFSLLSGLFAAVGPFLAGRIAEATNSYQLLYLFGAAANLVFVALILFVKPTRVEQETIAQAEKRTETAAAPSAT